MRGMMRYRIMAFSIVVAMAAISAAELPATRPVDLVQIQATLTHGDSAARLAILDGILNSAAFRSLDDSLLPAVIACADDPSPKTRARAAVLIGLRWIQLVPVAPAQALAADEKLARDPDVGVQHDALTAGLARVKNKDDPAVIAALVDAAMLPNEYNNNIHFFAVFGLRGVSKQRLTPLLEPYWANAKQDPTRAARAYLIYRGAINEEPPDVQRLDHVGMFAMSFTGKRGYGRDEIDAELKRILPANVTQEWHLQNFRGAVTGRVIVNGVAGWRQVIAALGESDKIRYWDDISQTTTPISAEDLATIRREAGTSQPPPATQGTYAGSFQDLYDHLGNVYPNFQMKGIDWKAVGDELLPRGRSARTEREFGLLVEELVARLQDSHAQVLANAAQPPEPDLPEWEPGISCLIDDRDRPVVYAIEPGSEAEKAGVKVGMAVVDVNGTAAEEAMNRWIRSTSKYYGGSSDRVWQYDAARSFLSQDHKGARVKLHLENSQGRLVAVDLAADFSDRYVPRLPVPQPGIIDTANVSSRLLPNGIGYIYVRRIQAGLEDSLDQALRDFGAIRGLVIDVRGNSGGGFDAETAVRNFDLSPQDIAEPKRPRYRGPIALLIDGRCISAAEGWTSWFVANKRAALFGSTTAGASSRKETYTLTNGLYDVVVPVKAYTGFLDRPIERRGLEPDVAVRYRASDLARGRDTVLDTAVGWLGNAHSN
jgi:carboxyl-terminal processing protease